MSTVNQQLNLSIMRMGLDKFDTVQILGPDLARDIIEDIQNNNEWTDLKPNSKAWLDWTVVQNKNPDTLPDVYKAITGKTLAKNYNENHDHLGRFASGGGSGSAVREDGSVSGSKVLGENKAQSASSNSDYKTKIYHGTSQDSALEIASNGFKAGEGSGDMFGRAVYFTEEPVEGVNYGLSRDDVTPKVASAYLNTKNMYTGTNGQTPFHNLVSDKMVQKGFWKEGEPPKLKTFQDFSNYDNAAKEVGNELLSKHDAVRVPGTDQFPPMVLVSKPSIVKISSIEDADHFSDNYFKSLGL